MRLPRFAAFAAMSSLALFPSVAQAGTSCWYPNEIKAAQLRGLQSMLMVGTLKCRKSSAASVDLYNSFITRQRGFLDANVTVLKAHFMRENGIVKGQEAYDSFATLLANQYSERPDDAASCPTIESFARLAAGASHSDLLVLAQSLSEAPTSGLCPPSNYRFEQTARPPTAEPSPAPQQPAAVSVAASSEAPVTPGPVVAAKMAAVEPTKTEAVLVAAKAEPAPKAAAPSREEVLQAAIGALQAAATALQAVSGTAAPTPTAEATAGDKPAQVITAAGTSGK